MKSLGQTLYEKYTANIEIGPKFAWAVIANQESWERLAKSISLEIDPYYLLRNALKEGNKIEVQAKNGTWGEVADPTFILPPELYRIKEFKLKVGGYYKHNPSGRVYILTSKNILFDINTGHSWYGDSIVIGNLKVAFSNRIDEFQEVDLSIEEVD